MASKFPVLILFFLLGTFSWADSEADYTVSLVTTGPGTEVYLWWGHTALLVEDHSSGEDYLYDFGVFSFETENFFTNFILGRLWYLSYRSQAEANLRRMIREDRRIRIQTLRFPPGNKIKLVRELELRVLPENREYLYEYYRDNCATRIRDLLNEAYNGKLREVSAARDAMTLRLQTRRFTSRNRVIEWLLMFLMSGNIDQPISGWEAMFLPSEIPVYLDELAVQVGPENREPAVASDTIVYLPQHERPVPAVPGNSILPPLISGVISALLLLAGRLLQGKARFVAEAFFRLLLFLGALLGTVLFFLCFFTDHAVTHGNWNLLLLNPLHWVTLFAPYRIGRTASIRLIDFFLFLPWIITIDASIFLIFASLFGFPAQDVGLAIALLLPIAIGICGPWILQVLKPRRRLSIVN
jgi:hypothetical protein